MLRHPLDAAGDFKDRFPEPPIQPAAGLEPVLPLLGQLVATHVRQIGYEQQGAFRRKDRERTRLPGVLAHDLATQLERELNRRLNTAAEVSVHVEPAE